MFEIDFLGMKIKNPLMLTEGPLSGNEEFILKAAQADLGLIFTKGIRPEPILSPTPYLGIYDTSLMNGDWSCIGYEAWKGVFSRIGGDVPLVASIAKNYVTPETAADMAAGLQKAGARIISLVDYNPQELIKAVSLARPRIKVPLMVKLPPFLPNLEEVLRGLVHAGVDAIAAMDSIGPVLSIDTETGAPLLGSADGSGYLSGKYILPVTLKYIYEIARFVNVPVVGVGGVTDGDSAVQMMMAGATGVGMVTEPMISGLKVFGDVMDEIKNLFERRGFRTLEEIRGLTLRRNTERSISELYKADIDPEKCIDCGICAEICYSNAIDKMEGVHKADHGICTGCGLCAGVCPVKAIKYILI
ncbi:MAG: 4Fe-4S binding protein [Spirochaetales bacterium]|nr:4Fe-4S binding protein [Spirochaetales bacterium]